MFAVVTTRNVFLTEFSYIIKANTFLNTTILLAECFAFLSLRAFNKIHFNCT